ncbi:RNA polymerase subunit sigma-70 [Lentzea flava]|uniref:RNA polymerase sigma factor n=1 Tax=Lentzea flava TaxID=103732 RepID=A0ABQ2UAJ0_9PSEU|nr:RNA polymerase subunit sigma-70 [Lentzea flava]MCP2196670.1 RNA polymerase sigma-70 factor, ECF subfamily [Lentzea flava]GGU16365.1 RNA polymerase sigma factor [Lentzea flava]
MGEDSAVVAAAREGDERAFTALVERYRPELRVHCYRMLGSFEEAEDLTQEAFLRAWRSRETYQGRSTFRAWLYRIATNACLDFLDRSPRRALPDPPPGPVPPAIVPWLQPCPDAVLAEVESAETGPDAVVVAKETIELAFLAAIQYLQPRQRAVLILRDVLGWSAKETALQLESTVAAVNSMLQRARPVLKERLPERRLDWAHTGSTDQDREILQRYMAALERADDDALAALLSADARASQQSGAGGHEGEHAVWCEGRQTILDAWAPALHGPHAVRFKVLPATANRQPVAASYIRSGDEGPYRAFALTSLRIEDGLVAETATFGTALFPAFGLPAVL